MATELTTDLVVDPELISAHLDDPALRLVEVDVSSSAYDADTSPALSSITPTAICGGPTTAPSHPTSS
jgi:hypothetical protein